MRTIAAAVDEIVASSRTQFDPEVVKAILQMLGYDRPERRFLRPEPWPSTNR